MGGRTAEEGLGRQTCQGSLARNPCASPRAAGALRRAGSSRSRGPYFEGAFPNAGRGWIFLHVAAGGGKLWHMLA